MALPIKFTELDYDKLIEKIIEIVKDHPQYNSLWDDFLLSNIGRLLIELFSYIGDNLATRIDWVANENWIETATQKKSIIRILKLLGYNFDLPVSSLVNVKINHENFPGAYYLTNIYNSSIGSIIPFSLQTITETGENRIFEAIRFDSENNKYDYKSGIAIENRETTIPFYEGKTIIDNFEVITENGATFSLTRNPIIQNSVIVYLLQRDNNTIIEKELNQVETFLSNEAQTTINSVTGRENAIPYLLNVNENDTVSIEFGSIALLPNGDRRPKIGDRIKVFYRVGGGLGGNIIARKINTNKTLTVSLVNGGTSTIRPTFINEFPAGGGKDGEDPSVAVINAPKEIRTVRKAVTVRDYETLFLNKEDVLLAKTFGTSNTPNNLYDLYKERIKPLEVWNYIIPNTAGRSGIKPSQYNDFEWMSLRKQNVYNEEHKFYDAEYNFHVEKNPSEINRGKGIINGDSYFNYVILETSQTFKDGFDTGDTNFTAKISVERDEREIFETICCLLINQNNNASIIPNYSLTTGTGNYGDSRYSYEPDHMDFLADSPLQLRRFVNLIKDGDSKIEMDGNAYFISNENLYSEEGHNLNEKGYKIKLNIDDEGDTEIDISSAALDTTKNKVRTIEIMAAINKGFHNYAGDSIFTYGSADGLEGIASIVKGDTLTEEYIKITSPRNSTHQLPLFSSIRIKPPTDNNATGFLFGDSFVNSGDSFLCVGKRSITLDTNSKNIIYEHGSSNLNIKDFYIHCSWGDTHVINISESGDGEHIYNTKYISTGDTEIDPLKSNFVLKFTKDKIDVTKQHSITAINNFWDLKYGKPAEIISKNFPNKRIHLTSSNYQLTFGIDFNRRNLITIDVTGDNGQRGDNGDSYTLQEIVNNINQAIGDTNLYSSRKGYENFQPASIRDGNKIVIRGNTEQPNNYVSYDNNFARLNLRNSGAFSAIFSGGYPKAADNITVQRQPFFSGSYFIRKNPTTKKMELYRYPRATGPHHAYSITHFMPGRFYLHYIWDRNFEETVKEDEFHNFLEDKKIVGINNIFKQTKFYTFDIVGDVYYKPTFTEVEVKREVEEIINNEFNLFDNNNKIKAQIGQNIYKSTLIKIITSVDSVEHVNINYFGKDAQTPSTNEDLEINTTFDEVGVLSENILDNNNNILHGINLSYQKFN